MSAMHRPGVNATVKKAVHERDGNTCRKCGGRQGELHAHHLQPACEGGSETIENLVTLCRTCHMEWEALSQSMVIMFWVWLAMPPAAVLLETLFDKGAWPEEKSAAAMRRALMDGSACKEHLMRYRGSAPQRMKDVLRRRVEQTGDSGGMLPYGYVRTPNGIRIDRRQAYVVREIFARRDTGESLATITNALNIAGHRPNRANHFQRSAIREILSRRSVYEGGPRGTSRFTWPVILHDAERVTPTVAPAVTQA